MKEKTAANPENKLNNAKPTVNLSPKQDKDFSSPGDPTFGSTLFLQRNLGNLAIQRMLETRAAQAKLTIGQPNDIYEQEADRVADQVMRMPEPKGSLVNGHLSLVQRQSTCPGCEEEEKIIQTKSLAEQITPLVQRQVEPEEEEEEEESAQRKALSNKTPPMTVGLQHSIQSLQGGGKSLSLTTRKFFESRFGQDFSQVKVHNNSHGVEIAKAIKARAFTMGNNIVFGSGEYAPETTAGKRLLAHELVHTVQQKKSRQMGEELNLQRQEEASGEPRSLPEVPNHITIDLLDPLNSSIRILGLSLPSPRDVINGLNLIRGIGSPQFDPPNITWPRTELTEEELLIAACRAAPVLCQDTSALQPEIGRLRLPSSLTLPRLQMPRLLHVSSEIIDHFEYNKDNIPDRHRELLDRTATDMLDHSNYFAALVGHTDTHGGVSNNQRLSERRARAVRGYLTHRAVPGDQITSVRGVGETQPRFNDDQVNWLSAARNRRVEMTIKRVAWEADLMPRLLIPPLRFPSTMPAAALIGDQRAAVLPAERPMFVNLRNFMRDVTQRIRSFVARSPEGTGLLTRDNENIISLLELLDQLNDELGDERLIIRFDHTGSNTGASYTELDDIIHLRAFTSNEEKARVGSGLIHEYTHKIQDSTMESLLRASQGPLEHTREDELWKEIEARRQGSYFIRLLLEIGINIGDPLGEELTARVYVGNFERERTGSPREQEAARREIREELRGYYTPQMEQNAPTRMYLIRVDDDNRAWLHSGLPTPVDLGIIPDQITTRSALITHLSTAVQASRGFENLFVGPRRVRYNFVRFSAFYQNQKLAEFGLARP